MSIGADVFDSQPVVSLRDMFAAEYAYRPGASGRGEAAPILNALGACGGFAAQIAVWRELVLPNNRNPGDFLVFVGEPSRDVLFFGEAINQFLLLTGPDRLSFLSHAGASLSNASQLPDISELVRHVAQSVGSNSFGQPRVPPSIDLAELPRTALTRTWGKTAQILKDCRPAEWPALIGAATHLIINSNRTLLAPPLAVRIVLEAAVPMSKLNPATVEDSGVPAPSFTNWSMRALKPENNQAILAEVRAAMPAVPAGIGSAVIDRPKIAFVNLAGASCARIAAQDRDVIGEAFGSNVESTTVPVPCDVLFLYCSFDASARIVGHQGTVRSVIRDSGAKIAVLASPVPSDLLSNREFQAAMTTGNYPPVNLVMTLNRNGDKFGPFFKSLFEMMGRGMSMPMAWVELAPQGPHQRDDIPGTIYLPQAGHVRFATGSLSGQ